MDGSDELAQRLRERLAGRAWIVRTAEGSVRARHATWPPQMEILLDPDAPAERARYAVVIDFRSLPFTGERFKDIFNHDREELLQLFGAFRVWQRRAEGGWGAPVGDRAFLGGFGSGAGLARQTVACMFERTPVEAGQAVVDRFVTEVARVEEVGAELASALQRVYQRTVLASAAAMGPLYSDEAGEAGQPSRIPPPAEPEATYPWRR